ncbi:hypothetical protein AHMF7605_16250 [Adhaeribacter arboris]|uniref:Uncharacterized protein n=1 Tax=Adhaeribacter arboris TaxID=2072846 RepID=A0A2T2YHG2_9BACT|nr:hypothetical protein [Adhaeribacter arboris]PSR54944.1 hypothetical protein AHMF7605_16250 [Adhaeribacter arboris]
MIQYIIFNQKEEVEAFGKTVDTELGFPKVVAFTETGQVNPTANLKTYATFATPIKKYNAEKYAYPITENIVHLVPSQKEMKFDLENWYCDAII